MKLVLEVANNSYQTVLDFISLLPEKQCQVLSEETAALNSSEIKKFDMEHLHQVLPVDTKLMLALTIRPPELGSELKQHLQPISEIKPKLDFDCFKTKWSVNTQFVEIVVVGPTEEQKKLSDKPFKDGGVFLKFEGLGSVALLLMAFYGTPNSNRLIKSPITMLCIRIFFEKQMVLRTRRLIRVRQVKCLRSIFCVFRLPTMCCSATGCVL